MRYSAADPASPTFSARLRCRERFGIYMKKRILSLLLVAAMMVTTLAFELPTDVKSASWGASSAAFDMSGNEEDGDLLYHRFDWGANHPEYIYWGAVRMNVSNANSTATRFTVVETTNDPFTAFPLHFEILEREFHDYCILFTYTLPVNSTISGLEIFLTSSSNTGYPCNQNFSESSKVISPTLIADGQQHAVIVNISSISGTSQFNSKYLSLMRFDLLGNQMVNGIGGYITAGDYIDISSMVFCDSLAEALDYADDKNISIANCTYNAWDANGQLYASSGYGCSELSYTINTPPAYSQTGYDFTGWTVKVDNNTFDSGDSTSYHIGANTPFEFSGVSPADQPNETEARKNQHINVNFIPELTPKTYTITFDANGGSYNYSTLNYKYQSGDRLPPDVPTRDGYTFVAWVPIDTNGNWDEGVYYKNEEIDDEYGNVTLSAKWEANTYTVTWKNEDGTTLETDTGVATGTTPTYNGSTPTKAGNAQYTYTFSHWTPAVGPISSNTTYTAVFSSTVNKYNVTFKNYDGTVLQQSQVEYGATPSYDSIPSRPGTAEYSYAFSGWDKKISAVTGNVEYTAQYIQAKNTYTVTWVDGNGTTLKTDTIEYGETPEYNGDTPTKTATDTCEYEWTGGWAPEISSVTGNVTYTATFHTVYTITWINDNGSVIKTDKVKENVMPEAPETPTKEANDQYTYTFDKWSPEVVAATKNQTYQATYTATVNTYTVTFVGHDGFILQVAELEYGATPKYTGETPTKPSTDQYDYTFTGWSPAIEAATKDITYTATFQQNLRTFTIVWKNYDGTVLETDENVPYGTKPSYDGETPVREATEDFYYTFNGWEPILENTTTEDKIYTAKFRANAKYVITYDFSDGTVTNVGQYTVKYAPSEAIVLPILTRENYNFLGWTVTATEGELAEPWAKIPDGFISSSTLGFDTEDQMYGNVTLTAVFELTITDLVIEATGTKTIDENQSYIFDITNSNDYSLTVVVYGDSSVTVKDIPMGTYTVTEQDGWSWRYSNSSTDSAETITLQSYTYDSENPEAPNPNTVTFAMTRASKENQDKTALWLSGDSYKRNKFGIFIAPAKDDENETN